MKFVWQRYIRFIVTMTTLVLLLWLPMSLSAQSQSPVVNSEDHQLPASTFHIISTRHRPQHATGKIIKDSLRYYSAGSEQKTRPIKQFTFYQSIQSGVPVCIFVHGSYVRWNDVAADSANVNNWVQAAMSDKPIQLVYLTWSSEPTLLTTLPQLDTNILGLKSEFNGLYLAQIISQIPQNCPITLIGHSNGSRTVASALHLLGGGVVQRYQLSGAKKQTHRIRVLLTAAAIDHDWLNPKERYGLALTRAEHIVSLRSRDDWALAIYPFRRLFSKTSLGRSGWSIEDYTAMGSMKSKVTQHDVTCQIGSGHGWPHYGKRKDIARFFGQYLYFLDHKKQENLIEQQTRQLPLWRDSSFKRQRPLLRDSYSTYRQIH